MGIGIFPTALYKLHRKCRPVGKNRSPRMKTCLPLPPCVISSLLTNLICIEIRSHPKLVRTQWLSWQSWWRSPTAIDHTDTGTKFFPLFLENYGFSHGHPVAPQTWLIHASEWSRYQLHQQMSFSCVYNWLERVQNICSALQHLVLSLPAT